MNFSDSKIYTYDEIGHYCDMICDDKCWIVTTNKKISYYNIPSSFDIETTSFRPAGNPEQKAAIMYIWMFGISGRVTIGRTWDEFLYLMNMVSDKLRLSLDRRLVVYVHNLGYEFQFIRKLMNWNKVFSIKKRRPLYAISDIGVEFKCSYFLTGYSLSKVGENLTKYQVCKMVGDLDYSKIRNSKTVLTDKEMQYCINDVQIVMARIQEAIYQDGNITKIPLTKTGYVRNYCRNSCLYEGKHRNAPDKYRKYRMLMDTLRLDPHEYEMLKDAFMGGFTHANAQYVRRILHHIRSLDFTSSYPYVLFSEKYPMSKGEFVKIKSIEQFEDYMTKYCCVFQIEFYNIYSTTFIENYISSSHCTKKKGVVENNGRIVSAEHIQITITEIDYQIIKKFYTAEKIIIHDFVIYKKGYLPTDLMKAMLKLYADKTMLKGVKGKEIEYLNSKEMINAIYGMMVTDICRDEIFYECDIWDTEKPELEKAVTKVNNSKKRFLFYAWGIYVTAYARRNLFTAILEFGNDYVYSDTDSVKVKNYENHTEYVKRYNKLVISKLEIACKHHGIDMSMCRPKTIKGVEKILGVWDDEGEYRLFKTLGAKRYMVKKEDNITLTVSGLNKRIAIPYLLRKYKTDVFKAFDDDLYVPAGKTGKNTLTYIDDEVFGTITDYQGHTEKFYSPSSIHMEASSHALSMSEAFLNYLAGIEEIEE